MNNNMNGIIADALNYLHIAFVLYIIVGWYFTPIRYIHLYLFIIIFIILDWNDFDGLCTLTKMEDYFRNNNSVKEQKEQSNAEFFRPLIKKLFNINMTHKDSTKLNYFIFMLVFLFGFLRMLYHYRIVRFPFYHIKK